MKYGLGIRFQLGELKDERKNCLYERRSGGSKACNDNNDNNSRTAKDRSARIHPYPSKSFVH